MNQMLLLIHTNPFTRFAHELDVVWVVSAKTFSSLPKLASTFVSSCSLDNDLWLVCLHEWGAVPGDQESPTSNIKGTVHVTSRCGCWLLLLIHAKLERKCCFCCCFASNFSYSGAQMLLLLLLCFQLFISWSSNVGLLLACLFYMSGGLSLATKKSHLKH